MPANRHVSGKLKLTRRWRRRVLWSLLVLIGATVGAGYYVTRPQRLAQFSASLLERFTGASARIDMAFLSWSGRIELEGVVLSVPEVASPTGRLFEAERIVLQPNWWTAATGPLRLGSILMMRPVLYVTEDYDADTFNFQMLARHALHDDDEPVDHLPELYVRHATVAFGTVQDGTYTPLDSIGLEGKIRASADHAAAYFFSFHQRARGAGPGPTLTGQFDLKKKAFSVELERFQFDRPERNFLSRELRAWWDLLEPRGHVPRIRIAYTAERQLRAVVSLADGQINVPYENFQSRMTSVSGQFVIEGDRVLVNDLSGSIEGIRYTVNGEVQGLSADAPFRINIQTDEFEIPDDPQKVAALPAVVHTHFRRFSPSGRFWTQATIARRFDEAGAAQFDVHGTLHVVKARGKYELFAYPLHDLTGKIIFTDQRVDVMGLRGVGPNGGTVTINGTVAPPARGAQVALTIEGADIPMDAALEAAMGHNHRNILRMLINQDAYRRLLQRGVLQSSDGSDQRLPRFSPGGQFDLHVDLRRPLGLKQKFAVTTTIDPLGIGLLIERWPYPLTITGGRIVVDPEKTTVNRVSALSPTGGTATVSGTVGQADAAAPRVPTITVERARLPIDDLLLASLPQPQDRWIADLNLTGGIAAVGQITGDPSSGKIGFAITAELQDAAANPFGGGFALRDVTGRCEIRHDGIKIDRITGKADDGTLSATGTARWGSQLGAFDMHFEALDVPFDRSLLNIVPPNSPVSTALRELMQTYRPTGVADATLHLSAAAGAEGETYQATLRPKTLSFDLNKQRIRLTSMSGDVLLQPGIIKLNQLVGRSEEGSFEAWGDVHHGGRHVAILNFTAQVDRLGLTTRALLPNNVLRIVDYLGLDGGFNVKSGRLVTRPHAVDQPNFEFISTIAVTGGSATVGVPISDLDGTLTLEITASTSAPWPQINLNLEADRVRAADRLIAPLRMNMSTDQDTGRFQIGECRGTIYGGSFLGVGWLQLVAGGDYSFDLKIHDVDIDAFVDPDQAPDPARDPVYDSGRLSANLLIEASYANPQSRRGRGQLRIVDASLYENPLPLAVLQTLNFTLPTSRSFQEASARYIIDGNDVLFDDLRFKSPSIVIAGKGSMDWTSLELDLHMVTRNPQPLLPNAVDEMINVFKDELVNIHVAGTLGEPKARLTPFSGVRESWDALFGETRAKIDAEEDETKAISD